ncbi:MAG: TetR/AcrR family transcriptional regulator [Thermodesulfobacteriota bacterium]|nr:TetR/AcrR family transcriptional regulator [Thermodesulfobacteriota bacterium]
MRRPKLEKDMILEAGACLFAEKGYASTSVRDISIELNVSIAALYYHFKNKEALLFNIIESIGNDLLDILNKIKEEPIDPLERLSQMLSGHFGLLKNNRYKVKVYVEEQHNLSKKLKKIIYMQHRRIYDIYLDQLKELKRLKIISSDPLSVAAFAMFGIVNWTYRWYKENDILTIDDVAQRLIDVYFHGIINTEKRSSPGCNKLENTE